MVGVYVKDISKALTDAGAKGTFFWNGNNCEPHSAEFRGNFTLIHCTDGCIYSADNVAGVKFAYGQGHMVASHTWDHKDLSKLSSTEVDSEMSRVDLALERLIGVKPAFMRPPYGNYNDVVRQVAAARGQSLVTWDFDSGDSTGSTAAQSNAAYDKLAESHPSTILALNHEVYGAQSLDLLDVRAHILTK